MKIFVSHPYGRRNGLSQDEIEENVKKSIEIGRQLIAKGHIPFIPNLYHYVHSGWLDTPDEDMWLQISLQWIEPCDAFYYGGQSTGCDREYQEALSLGKIIYKDIDEVPEGDINNATYFIISDMLKTIRKEMESKTMEIALIMADAILRTLSKKQKRKLDNST